jgi:hypothetical protein
MYISRKWMRQTSLNQKILRYLVNPLNPPDRRAENNKIKKLNI